MIKTFERFILSNDKTLFYRISVKKSIERFKVALDKLGIRKLFYEEWEEDKPHHIQMIENYNIVYLIIDKTGGSFSFYLEPNFSDLKYHYNYKEFGYGGYVTVEDFEVDANKYNI